MIIRFIFNLHVCYIRYITYEVLGRYIPVSPIVFSEDVKKRIARKSYLLKRIKRIDQFNSFFFF